MSSEPPPPIYPPRWRIWLLGLFAGSVATGLLSTAIALLVKSAEQAGLVPALLGPGLVLLPMIDGLTAAYFWRKAKPTFGKTALLCLYLTLIDIAGAGVLLHEGVICLLIVSPLFYALVLTGSMIGRTLFKHDSSRLRISVLPLVALLALAEPFTRADQTGVVTDEILIRARPARVWPQITAFPPIPAPPRFWLFRLGLPYPVATTSAGDYPGADRSCIFSRNAVFKEAVAGLVPDRELTFDILEVPPDPELLGHLTPQRGQFLLRDNGDGTTTLTGSTWYTLHVRPLWYFDWWTQHIFRAVHLRVMEDVKRRAEA